VTAGAAGTGGAGGGALGEEGENGSTGVTAGGAINQPTGSLKLANTILANSAVASVAGFLNDLGGNITTDTNSILNSSLSFKNSNPRLRALANNGGPTPTMAIATNSPAIDKAVAQYCIPFDQRGTNRQGACDIGAFELMSTITLPSIPTNVLNLTSTRNLTNSALTVLWPSGYTNLYLQFSTNLNATNAWVTFTNAGPVSGSNFSFTLNTTNSSRPKMFFRLQGLTNSTVINTGGLPGSTDTNIFPPFPPFPTP
jgi:hypothetical protein